MTVRSATGVRIAAMAPEHAKQVLAIYQLGIDENTASLALHRRAGFRVIGTRERIGRHHGRWRDVILIERRSPTVR